MRKERPSDDADAAEIAEWMADDFGWALADGMRDASESKGDTQPSDSQ